MTDRELEAQFPWIQWRRPIPVRNLSSDKLHYGCRYCMAQRGLKGSELHLLPTSEQECLEHIDAFHPLNRQATFCA